jgi:3-hydroxy-3-methylglutaryl CoA synthase
MLTLTFFVLSRLVLHQQSRCESILRTQPNARFAKELHLACIEADEEKKREQLKQAAVGSLAAAAVVGVIGIASMLLAKK